MGERTSFYGGINYLITYIYGAEGSVIGLDVNGTAYYFVKNLQGDVTSIIDINGNILANYSYDAYGYIRSITDGNGNEVTSATHIANLNPFRYRGYMYDQETGFYYLRSRYYDPAVCRFLNADGMVSTGQGFDGNNMFAYCNSNPVSFYDPDGDSFIALALAGAAINLATSYLGALITGQEYTWADAGIDVASGFISAIPIVGPWFGAAISGIWTGISTFNNGSSIGGAIFSGVADAVLTMGSIGNLANFCGNSVDLVTTIALDSTFGAANSFISSVVSVSAVEMSNNKTANTPTITNTAYSAFETIKRKQSMSKVRIVDGRKIIVDSKMSYVDEREYNRLYCYVEFYGG